MTQKFKNLIKTYSVEQLEFLLQPSPISLYDRLPLHIQRIDEERRKLIEKEYKKRTKN